MPFCNQNGKTVPAVRFAIRTWGIPFLLQKCIKNWKNFKNVKYRAWTFQKRPQNVHTTSRSNFMTPDVQLVKGQNRQNWHKNAIFCVQVVNSNYHKNRTRRRKNIPRTFLESLGPILCIRRKKLGFHAFLQPERFFSDFTPNVDLHLV